jgi:threonine dehydrogenase-like Zn-dependent dehydrogenase
LEALVIRPGKPARLEYVGDHGDPAARRGEVIIRVHLAGICATDLEILRGYLGFGGVPGHEFVGTVVAGSKRLQGRRVVAEINCACGACDMCKRGMPRHCRRRTVLGIDGRDGAFAGLVSVPERNCHIVPDAISDEQAVFVEPLAAAVQVIKLQPIDRSMDVVVLGAGRLGLLVAQVLKLQGCGLRVVGRNRETLAVCERHGIQVTELPDLVPEPVHDVVVDCTGSVEGLRLAMEMCRPLGTIVLKSTYAEPAKIDLAPLVINEIRVVGNRCGPFPEALDLLRGRKVAVEEIISRTYPLRQGNEAFAAARLAGNIKVLLRPGAS